MVDMSLVMYIKNQLQKGYDSATIRKFLLENNYPAQEVDAALQSAGAVQQGTAPQYPPQQQTAQQQLVQYIKQYLKQGYSVEQIRTYLLQYGYPSFVVQYALTEATKKRFAFPIIPKLALPSRKTFFISLLILFVLAIIAATTWFFMNIKVEEAKPEITFGISVDKSTVAPGETLYITNDFSNLPSEREYKATIYYTIVDATGTQIDSWEISFGAEDAVVKNTKYALLPSIDPDDYVLEGKMVYGTVSKQEKTSFTVTISEEELVAAEEKAEEEAAKEEAITEEVSVEEEVSEEEREKEEAEEVVVKQEVTITGIPTASDYQNYATAKELAATDAEGAAVYCEKISSLSKKDECYSTIARESKDKSYCEQIVSDPTRDSCWVSFAFNQQDYTVCAEIANPFIKQSCEQLEKVAALKEQSSS